MRGPSLTARGVAEVRATIDREGTLSGDHAGADRLSADLRTGLSLHLGGTMCGYLTARTRFFDEVVEGAVASAPTQIVILGAGYDDRSLRFRSHGVQFVEIDHPDTQRDKLERL